MEHIIITGANRGIGLALAALYASTGSRVFACCRQPLHATELTTLAQAHSNISVHELDVTNDTQISHVAMSIGASTDTVDVLINNAGINGKPGTRGIANVERAALNTMIDTNAVSALMVSQAMLPMLRNSSNPRIVMISSQVGSLSWIKPGGNGFGYAMSKAAMNMAARVLSAELGSDGIISITMHPGWVRTDMGGDQGELSPEESAQGIKQVIDGLTPDANGGFFKWNGDVHPW